MDADLCDQFIEKLSIQPSTSERKPEVFKCIDQVSNDADNKCEINIFADIIPILGHDCCKNTNFYDWRKQVEPITNAFPLTCESKGEAINFLKIEQVKEERKRKVKEAELEQKLFWKRMQLEECRKSLQEVQEQFDDYKSEVEPLEEPEWFDELLKDD
ncbi:unnamed protein product [Lupinus luteus]|uniref:Uncharacterized protein n=1 Tax=Lupinus luteus TaxID=3873 RepID=A0AAV1Y7K8_LUPLU